jgi:hypothetical protein
MTSHRLLQLNALSTAACGLGMLATRESLYRLFGAASPVLFDVIAIGLLAYAAALAVAARQHRVEARTLMAFTVADGLWVAGSAIALLVFWSEFTPLARLLVVAVAIVVEAFATLQFLAARRLAHSPS